MHFVFFSFFIQFWWYVIWISELSNVSFYLFLKIVLLIHLCCAGSSLLCGLFSSWSEQGKHLITWAAWTWEEHKTQAQPSLRLWGLPECLNLSGLDLGAQPRAGLWLFPAEQPRAQAVWAGRLHAPWAGADPVRLRHCEHMPVLFVCSIPPSPQRDWTSEP